MILFFFSTLAGVAIVALACVPIAFAWAWLQRAVEAREWREDEGRHLVSVSPTPCRACGRVGYCHSGCSRLDRLDARPRRGDVA